MSLFLELPGLLKPKMLNTVNFQHLHFTARGQIIILGVSQYTFKECALILKLA